LRAFGVGNDTGTEFSVHQTADEDLFAATATVTESTEYMLFWQFPDGLVARSVGYAVETSPDPAPVLEIATPQDRTEYAELPAAIQVSATITDNGVIRAAHLLVSDFGDVKHTQPIQLEQTATGRWLARGELLLTRLRNRRGRVLGITVAAVDDAPGAAPVYAEPVHVLLPSADRNQEPETDRDFWEKAQEQGEQGIAKEQKIPLPDYPQTAQNEQPSEETEPDAVQSDEQPDNTGATEPEQHVADTAQNETQPGAQQLDQASDDGANGNGANSKSQPTDTGTGETEKLFAEVTRTRNQPGDEDGFGKDPSNDQGGEGDGDKPDPPGAGGAPGDAGHPDDADLVNPVLFPGTKSIGEAPPDRGTTASTGMGPGPGGKGGPIEGGNADYQGETYGKIPQEPHDQSGAGGQPGEDPGKDGATGQQGGPGGQQQPGNSNGNGKRNPGGPKPGEQPQLAEGPQQPNQGQPVEPGQTPGTGNQPGPGQMPPPPGPGQPVAGTQPGTGNQPQQPGNAGQGNGSKQVAQGEGTGTGQGQGTGVPGNRPGQPSGPAADPESVTDPLALGHGAKTGTAEAPPLQTDLPDGNQNSIEPDMTKPAIDPEPDHRPKTQVAQLPELGTATVKTGTRLDPAAIEKLIRKHRDAMRVLSPEEQEKSEMYYRLLRDLAGPAGDE